jgi:hypothetical protein
MVSRVDQNMVAVALDAFYDTTPYDTLTYFHSNSDVGGWSRQVLCTRLTRSGIYMLAYAISVITWNNREEAFLVQSLCFSLTNKLFVQSVKLIRNLKPRSTIILHGSTSQKTILNIILAAVRTWNLTLLKKLFWCSEPYYPLCQLCNVSLRIIYQTSKPFLTRLLRTYTICLYESVRIL